MVPDIYTYQPHCMLVSLALRMWRERESERERERALADRK